MSRERTTGLRQLQALERWRQMQLETAQAHYAERAAQLEGQRALLEYCQQQCRAIQEQLRGQLQSAQPLSPSTLLRLSEFAHLQAAEEHRQALRTQAAQAAAEMAQGAVKQCFEQLSVVRKLTARRLQQWREAQRQRQQRMLDEQAAGRRAPPGGATQR